MEMENSKRPFLRWLSAQFRHAAKRVGEGRNAVTFFQNHLMKRIRSRFQPPVSAVEGKKKVAWVSLKGRLEGAEEATSSAAIKGHLGLEEAAAWELFSPLQRVLIFAVVAVAALERSQMAKQLENKDRMLSTLQKELDSMKHKEVSPVQGLDSIRGKEMSMQHEHSIKGCADVVQELDSTKQKIASLQKEIDNLKDKAEAVAQLIASNVALYVAKQAADAELYKKQKEAEGIKAVADALTKATGDDKTASLLIQQDIANSNPKDMEGLQPKPKISTDGGRQKNDSTEKSSGEKNNSTDREVI